MATDGHIAVRLPPSMSDQNPVIGRMCKTYSDVLEHIVRLAVNLQKLMCDRGCAVICN